MYVGLLRTGLLFCYVIIEEEYVGKRVIVMDVEGQHQGLEREGKEDQSGG